MLGSRVCVRPLVCLVGLMMRRWFGWRSVAILKFLPYFLFSLTPAVCDVSLKHLVFECALSKTLHLIPLEGNAKFFSGCTIPPSPKRWNSQALGTGACPREFLSFMAIRKIGQESTYITYTPPYVNSPHKQRGPAAAFYTTWYYTLEPARTLNRKKNKCRPCSDGRLIRPAPPVRAPLFSPSAPSLVHSKQPW